VVSELEAQGWCRASTSPPPMTRTGLLRICQARMREPPPWTRGNIVLLIVGVEQSWR
jgi:hypothetical protein